MNFHSLKMRFALGFFLLFLIVVAQTPWVYQMSQKINELNKQIEVVDRVGEKLVDLAFILTRHIESNDESLEEVYQKKIVEFDAIIKKLRNGSSDMKALEGKALVNAFSQLEIKWKEIESVFNSAMEVGDEINIKRGQIFDTSYPIVKIMTDTIKKYISSGQTGLGENINIAGIQRARTFIMAFETSRYVIASDGESAAQYKEKIVNAMNVFQQSLDDLKNGNSAKNLLPPPNKKVIENLEKVTGLWKGRKEALDFVLNNRDRYKKTFKDIESVHIREMVSLSERLSKILMAESRGMFQSLFIFVIAAGILAALIIGLIMHLGNKHTLKPLLSLSQMMEGYGKGDLTGRLDSKIRILGKEIRDEIVVLIENINEMGERMSEIIKKIRHTSDSLASASTQFLATFEEIGRGLGNQADQATQVSTAMEELTATVSEVSKHTQDASMGSQDAKNVAEKGEGVVRQTIDRIQGIEMSVADLGSVVEELGNQSSQIGRIVGVIDDIADQTNLLALNAAIEAARAGEHGRGFAVVADEVRKLAEKTQHATREIGTMILGIQEGTDRAVSSMQEGKVKVVEGVGAAQEAGESLRSIKTSVENVNNMITQIATATEQENSATEEVNQNMARIVEVIKETSSGVKEMTSAVEDLSGLAQDLKGLVERFKV